jgi:phosphoribosylformylglycinamidine cyclo-ligase
MYHVFNMGHRLEVYLDREDARTVIDLAGEFGIAARVVGYVEGAEGGGVRLITPGGVEEDFE